MPLFQPLLLPMSSVSEELKELEEYARQFEANTARNSGRDSVMTVTSSGGSYSAGDTLRPSPTFTSHRAGLPSLPPVLTSSQHTEQRDGSQGEFFKLGLGNGTSDSESISDSAEPRNAKGNCSTLQQSFSISDRITQIERLAGPGPAISVIRTRIPEVTEDEFRLSKSEPNLLSDSTEAAGAQGQADEAEVEDNMELKEDSKEVSEEGKDCKKLVREDGRVDDVYDHIRTKWAGLVAVKKPGKEKKIVKKKKALPQKIKRKKKGFTNEEISLAATILYSSRRVYNLLRNKRLIKLPCIRTVYKKLQHFHCEPGYNPQIFRLLELKLASLKEKDRVVGISFDEMHLEEKYSWSPLLRRLFGKHKKAQVVLARGIRRPWKMAVYYDFDVEATFEFVKRIIVHIEEAGGRVMAATCDMGNQSFLGPKGVNLLSKGNHSFPNPARPNAMVWVIPDPVHMIKLFRNHIWTHGLVYKDGNVEAELNISHFKQAVGVTGEIKLNFILYSLAG